MQGTIGHSGISDGTKPKKHKLVWIAVIIGILGILFGVTMVILGVSALWFAESEVEVHDDVSEYTLYRSGPQADENFRYKWGMDESIFPEKITPEMNVQDYRMVYYTTHYCKS